MEISRIFSLEDMIMFEKSEGNCLSYTVKCKCVPAFPELGFRNIALLDDGIIIPECIRVIIQRYTHHT